MKLPAEYGHYFVHRRLIGGITGLVTGGPLGAVAGFVGGGPPMMNGGGGGGVTPLPPRILVPRFPTPPLQPVPPPPPPARQPIGNGDAAACLNAAIITSPRQVVRNEPAMRNQVIVRCGGQVLSMDRDVARKFGLFTPRRKPPISAKDWKTLQTAASVQRKVGTVLKTANKVQGQRKWVRQQAASGRR